MTCSWRWFIQTETAISRNRNGSSTFWVFKAHYRDHEYSRELSQTQADPVFGPYGTSGQVMPECCVAGTTSKRVGCRFHDLRVRCRRNYGQAGRTRAGTANHSPSTILTTWFAATVR